MNKNLIISGAAALVAVIAVSGFAFSSFAADADETIDKSDTVRGRGMFTGQDLSDEEKAELDARHEEMQADREARRAEMEAAIDAGYTAWKSYVTEERGDDAQVLEVIDEDNFSRFTEAHNLIEDGQSLIDQGRTILEDELGVERGHMGMGGKGGKGGKGGHGGRGGMQGMGMHLHTDIVSE